jgi:hypothetical protein
MKNLFNFNRSPVLNFFKNKPKKVVFHFLPEESEILNAMKIVKMGWDEKQDQDPSISDEYKTYQIVSKVIKIFPKHEKSRVRILYDILSSGMLH